MSGRLVLLCLPHAGGSAAFFRPWRAAMDDAVEVIAVDIAGHGARRREPLPLTFAEAIGSVWGIITGYANGRYALFGHSLGALYAFEAARRLAGLGRPPTLLLASGRNAPAWPAELPDCHMLPDAELASRMVSYGGIPSEVASDPDLMQILLPVMRADMRIAERYVHQPGPPLRCPVIVFFGERDPLVSPVGVAAWQGETTSRCELISLPGGHFCPQENYLGRLRDALRPWTAAVS